MMDRSDILNYLSAHKDEFEKKYGIAKIGLFGSFARDEATETSDIDLLIQYVPNPGDVYTKKRSLKIHLQEYFHRDVDLANEKCLKPYAREDILRDAIYA